jgi:predicted DNA-binding transcriptional regulator AlpA
MSELLWVQILKRGRTDMRATSIIKHRIRVSDDPLYLADGQIRERFSVADMWICRHIKNHGFPKPMRFGGRKSKRFWRLAEIEQWERERARINSGGAS